MTETYCAYCDCEHIGYGAIVCSLDKATEQLKRIADVLENNRK